ncbi:hypothetical protein EDB84DRAFT_1443567 [Lactarius hengduanensis]|nr:hypothetical protein EDB84DRAFT_1443567 [Lactarius hengduanensis]
MLDAKGNFSICCCMERPHRLWHFQWQFVAPVTAGMGASLRPGNEYEGRGEGTNDDGVATKRGSDARPIREKTPKDARQVTVYKLGDLPEQSRLQAPNPFSEGSSYPKEGSSSAIRESAKKSIDSHVSPQFHIVMLFVERRWNHTNSSRDRDCDGPHAVRPPRPRRTRTARHAGIDGGDESRGRDDDGGGDYVRVGSDGGIHLKCR